MANDTVKGIKIAGKVYDFTGLKGADGHTPVIAATKENGVTIITSDDVEIARINDGAKGSDAEVTLKNIVEALGFTPAKEDDIPTVPSVLPNPKSLTIKVGESETVYDGSEEKSVEITSEGANDGIPSYVITAVDALAKKIVSHISSNNIVFATMADAHLGYYTDTDNAAGKQAGQALKRLNEICPLDFVVHLGDYSTGAWNTSAEDALEDNADYQLLIGSKYSGRSIWCPGNHDDAPYRATSDRLSQTQMYAAIGRKNQVSGGNVPDNACYGYMDFPELYLRIIYLDTHDHRSWGTTNLGSGADNPYLNADNISAKQLKYLINDALNFDGISEPNKWSILIFSHAALTGTGTYTDPVSEVIHSSNTANAGIILKAYAGKKSGSITYEETSISYDFTTVNPAQIIGCIHGHEHRYSDEKIAAYFLSICCPNILNGRERASADGNTYSKTPGTANGTSFCVFSINRIDKKIYVDHYGPGIDREFTYTILDPDATEYTNVLNSAIDQDGSIYNDTGWKSNYRLNSSGAEESYNGMCLTGFISISKGDIVRLKNVVWQYGQTSGITSNNQRICFYDSSKSFLGLSNGTGLGGTLSGVKDENNIWTQFTVKDFSGVTLDSVSYFRLCCAGITDDSIITVNEEIT